MWRPTTQSRGPPWKHGIQASYHPARRPLILVVSPSDRNNTQGVFENIMFIIWGTKAVYRKVGYAADFCSICRQVRPFLVRRIAMARHIYYLSTGEGKLVGFDRTCEQCMTSFPAEPQTYKTILKSYTSLVPLKNETFPNFSDVMGKRLEIEQLISDSPAHLSADDRMTLIKEPFMLLAPKVEQLYESTQIDKEVGISLIIGILIFALGASLSSFVTPEYSWQLILASFVIGVSLIIWSMSTSSTRHLKRKIAPVIAKCLRPLNPSQTELSEVLIELKSYGYKIGTKLTASDILSLENNKSRIKQQAYI
jgi:hypothetical protein